jgi:hypothetical protein
MAFFKRGTAVTPAQAPSVGGGSLASRIGTSGGVVVDRATEIYRKNPKAIGGAALVASALLLNFLKKRGTH